MAKKSVGSLAVILSLNSRAFSAGLKKASSRVGAFAKRIKGAAVQVLKFSAAIVATAAVALTVIVKKSMASLDTVGKLSDALNIGSKQLMAFHHAANISGASTEAMNKGLQILVRTIGEVETGISTEATKAFELLGISMDRIKGKDTGAIFKIVAEEISKMTSATETAAIANRLFGRGGKELMNVLMLGAAGISKLEEEAHKYGTTSRENIKIVEEANDSLGRVGKVFKHMADTITVNVSPFITLLSKFFLEAAGSAEVFADRVFAAISKIIDAVGALVNAFQVIKGMGVGLVGVAQAAFGAILGDMERRESGFEMLFSGAASARGGWSGESGAAVVKRLKDVQANPTEVTTELLKSIDDKTARPIPSM